MKAVLKFNLPEENWEYNSAIKGADMRGVLEDFSNWLRAEIKYKGKKYAKIQETFHRMLNEKNIDLFTL